MNPSKEKEGDGGWGRRFVRNLLKEKGIRPRRRLGQNFLVDNNLLQGIPRWADVDRADGVVEIGAGIGSLTRKLAERAGFVRAMEIDPLLLETARELLEGCSNVELIGADGALFGEGLDRSRFKRWKVVSNLPYAPYQRLVNALLSADPAFDAMVLMLQEEAWERMSALPGSRLYGPISVMVRGTCRVERIRKVGGKVFLPVPRVGSVLVRLFPRRRLDGPRLEPVLREMFAGRRKKFGAWLRKRGPAGPEEEALVDLRVADIPPETLLGIAERFL